MSEKRPTCPHFKPKPRNAVAAAPTPLRSPEQADTQSTTAQTIRMHRISPGCEERERVIHAVEVQGTTHERRHVIAWAGRPKRRNLSFGLPVRYRFAQFCPHRPRPIRSREPTRGHQQDYQGSRLLQVMMWRIYHTYLPARPTVIIYRVERDLRRLIRGGRFSGESPVLLLLDCCCWTGLKETWKIWRIECRGLGYCCA